MKRAAKVDRIALRTGNGVRVAAILLAMGLVGGSAGLGGCATGPDESRAGPAYPAMDQEQTLDIQVVRDETVITLTNTTVMPFKDARLWLNRWYSHPVDRFDVGQTLELSLWEFYDEFGEPFEAGGFFATRRPDRLVLAQLEADGELYGLVVVARGGD